MTEIEEQSYKKPLRGYKNIDLAKISINKLKESVKECSSDTPAHTLSATRWLENALYSREIIEEDYDRLMKKIKDQTRIFIGDCDCNGKI